MEPLFALFRVLFTLDSDNRKTGKIPVSMTHGGTCPQACAMRSACYASGGGLGCTWGKLTKGILPGMGWATFCGKVRALSRKVTVWRHNQAGDLPGRCNRLDRRACMMLATANAADGRNRGGFTYTHYPVLAGPGIPEETAKHNRAVIRDMNRAGFTVNLSADNLDMADRLASLGIGPVAVVLQRDAWDNFETAAGNRVVVCPHAKREIQCNRCRACTRAGRKVVIGLPAHGAAVKRAEAIARGTV